METSASAHTKVRSTVLIPEESHGSHKVQGRELRESHGVRGESGGRRVTSTECDFSSTSPRQREWWKTCCPVLEPLGGRTPGAALPGGRSEQGSCWSGAQRLVPSPAFQGGG